MSTLGGIGSSIPRFNLYQIGNLGVTNPNMDLNDRDLPVALTVGDEELPLGTRVNNVSATINKGQSTFKGTWSGLSTTKEDERDDNGEQTGAQLSTNGVFDFGLTYARLFDLGKRSIGAGLTARYYSGGVTDASTSPSSTTYGFDLAVSGKFSEKDFLTAGVLDLGWNYKDGSGQDEGPLPTSWFVQHEHKFSETGMIGGNLMVGLNEKEITAVNIYGKASWNTGKPCASMDPLTISINPGMNWAKGIRPNLGLEFAESLFGGYPVKLDLNIKYVPDGIKTLVFSSGIIIGLTKKKKAPTPASSDQGTVVVQSTDKK